ncbi:MAG TPA: aldehyde oxidase, partial [Xanthobacteraceae bacterium]
MAEQPVLIAAASGRALAVSARRGGYAPLVADWFGDADTLAVSARHVRLGTGLAGGMQDAELLDALDRLAAGAAPCGLVWGTGFEDRPNLLAR